MPRKKVEIGDLFSVEAGTKVYHIQCCSFDEQLGWLMRLIEDEGEAVDLAEKARKKTKYYFYFFLPLAIKRKYVTFIGSYDLPEEDRRKPTMMHGLPNAPSDPPRWRIVYPDGTKESVEHPSVEQLGLSEYGLLTPVGLILQLAADWTPRKANEFYIMAKKHLLETGEMLRAPWLQSAQKK